MIRFSKYVLEILLIAILLFCVFSFKLISYSVSQLQGQLSIISNTRPVREVMNDRSVPDSLKTKLLLIEDVRYFAKDSLGLLHTDNYTTFYDQKGKALLMNLTAAERFQLKSYTWYFPILGTVSYKGFFNFKKGEEEAEQLRRKNLDVDYGPVSAWSTLGWFKDPVFSGMLRRNAGQLAELIIHEMTHATVYLKSSVEFNENLASAVGETGAERFLAYKYGIQSKELETYKHEQDDYNRFAGHMLNGSAKLDSLYRSITAFPDSKKDSLKNEMISRIISTLDTVSFHGDRYRNRFKNEPLPNNTFFLAFVRYDAQKDKMKDEIATRFGGNIRAYLSSLMESD